MNFPIRLEPASPFAVETSAWTGMLLTGKTNRMAQLNKIISTLLKNADFLVGSNGRFWYERNAGSNPARVHIFLFMFSEVCGRLNITYIHKKYKQNKKNGASMSNTVVHYK